MTNTCPEELIDLAGGEAPATDIAALLCSPQPSTHRPLVVRNGDLRGDLDLANCSLTRPLVMDQVNIAGALDITEASVISLRLTACGMSSVKGRGVRVDHVLSIRKSEVDETIDLIESEVQDALYLSGTRVRNREHVANAVNLYCARLRGAAYLRKVDIEHGVLRLIDCTTEGILDLTGLRVQSGRRTAVFADRIEAPSVHFRDADISGRVSLTGGSVAGTVSFTGACIENGTDRALTLDSLISRRLMIRNAQINGTVSLRSADVGALVDNKRSWSGAREVEADGFQYSRFGDSHRETETDSEDEDPPDEQIDLSVEDRIDILCRRNRQFSPLPYAQLRSVYRSGGHEMEATKVAVAGAKDRLRRGKVTRPARWLGELGRPFGYGYRPSRALLALAVTITALWFVALVSDALVSTEKAVPGAAPTSIGTFERAAYATDVVLPIIDLGEADQWTVNQAASGATALQLTVWGAIILGWLFSTMFVIAVQRFFRDP